MFSKSILSRIYCLLVIICAFLGLGIKTGVFSGGLKLYTLKDEELFKKFISLAT